MGLLISTDELSGKTGLMDKQLIGAGEAARRLGVSSATIQRWVDAGVLISQRTRGGHRRIPLSEIRRILDARQPAAAEAPIEKWLEPLLAADPEILKKLMIAARRKSGKWSSVVEELAVAISEIGRRWELGSCRIFEEHAATEALRRSAAQCCAEMRCGTAGPTAALMTVAGDRHTLGLSLSELIVVEAGWQTLWLGDGPPTEELAPLIRRQELDLLIASASPVISRGAIARYQSGLECTAQRNKVGLILAGDGPWAPSEFGRRIYSFSELESALTELR